MLEWLGPKGEQLRIAFTKVFGSKYVSFGAASLRIGGVSDGNDGVQWQAGYDPDEQIGFAGVNLEGMQYDGWPIARLIEREIKTPALLSLIDNNKALGKVTLQWRRDYWRKQTRPAIVERFIAPTPITLSDLTIEGWQVALHGAYDCLDRGRKRKGRATQTVTLMGGEKVTGEVSPHLTFRLICESNFTFESFLREVKTGMQPLYDWAIQRASSPLSF